MHGLCAWCLRYEYGGDGHDVGAVSYAFKNLLVSADMEYVRAFLAYFVTLPVGEHKTVAFREILEAGHELERLSLKVGI